MRDKENFFGVDQPGFTRSCNVGLLNYATESFFFSFPSSSDCWDWLYVARWRNSHSSLLFFFFEENFTISYLYSVVYNVGLSAAQCCTCGLGWFDRYPMKFNWRFVLRSFLIFSMLHFPFFTENVFFSSELIQSNHHHIVFHKLFIETECYVNSICEIGTRIFRNTRKLAKNYGGTR